MIKRDWRSDAVKGSTPFLIWKSYVEDIAIENRCSGPTARRVGKTMLSRAWNAGEPVWMAAEELVLRIKQGGLHERADNETTFMRNELRRARRR
jgi:hypothetical protein